MTIEELLKDKSKKVKEKVMIISKWLLDGLLPTDELLAFAEAQKDSEKATCIEAIEFATIQNPKIADENMLAFITNTLLENAPRVKWESAKVIGNIAGQFPAKLDAATENLLINAEHNGTVVRWAAAFALGEILKLKTKQNDVLLPKIESLCKNEEENGVRKKYLDALKKLKK